jgi:outer membrane receptor for monomeric catechols
MKTRSDRPWIGLSSRLATGCCLLVLNLAPALGAQSPAPPPGDAASGDPVQLKPFDVVEQKSAGYRVSTASTATRTNEALIDIPQTVDIVTAEFWADINATQWDESFKYVPNVYVRNRHAGSGDGVNLRGFETNASITVDGVRMGNYKRDLVGYDRLEVVKGPPSAVQGRAGGTGLLNYILKKPVLGERWLNARYTYSFNDYDQDGHRVDFDGNYAKGSRSPFAFRAAGSWQKSDDYIKFGEFDNLSFYPSVRWRLGARTELVATGEFLDLDTPSREEGHGFALYPEVLRRLVPQFDRDTDPITALKLPWDFNVTGPGNGDKERLAAGTLFASHQFTPAIHYRQAVNWHYLTSDSITFTNGDNFNVANRASSRLKNQDYRHGFVAQGDLVVEYAWRRILASATTLGWAYTDTDSVSDSYSGVPDSPFNTLNLAQIAASGFSADFYAARRVSNLPRTTYTRTGSYGIGKFVQQELGFLNERLILNGGIRADRDHSQVRNLVTGAVTGGADTTLNSYRYGAIFKLRPQLALYVVKSVQNDPTRNLARYSRLLAGDPRLSERFTVSPNTELEEIGVKGELFKGRVTFTADYWEMRRKGSVITLTFVGESQGQNVSIGRQQEVAGAMSEGYEFSVFGSPTDRLSLIANYTRMSTSQQRPGAVDSSDRIALRFAPGWNANVFAKYSFRDAQQQGWLVKGGIAAVGPYYHEVTGVGLVLIPHRQKNIDLGVAYRWRTYDFDLTVTNVDNDPFMITRDQPPRTWRFSVSTRF